MADSGNWQNGSKVLTDFTEEASRLNLGERNEVKSFKAAVLDMITFSTTWMSRVDESHREQLASELDHAAKSVSLSLRPSVGGDIETGRRQSESTAAEVVRQSARLAEAQAERFRSCFEKLLGTYEGLLQLIQREESARLQQQAR